jgi:biotin synthase
VIRVSAGTACVLGLKKIRADVHPTTAYFMLGEKCLNNCAFCSQGRGSKADEGLLSRVVWPKYAKGEVLESLCDAFELGSLKRACLQVVRGLESIEKTKAMIKEIRSKSDIPVCASVQVRTVEDVKELLEAGADRVTLSIDAATPELFKKIKGSDFDSRLELLKDCAILHPGKISTHLIVGLGESEEEMIKLISWLNEQNITVALFAFTPIKGTLMEKVPRPDIGQYRRIQAAHYLMANKRADLDKFVFEKGKLISIEIKGKTWKEIVAADKGRAFQTSGCPDCNRPYYNESPRGVMYNYPRSLADTEVAQVIMECGLE